MELIKILVIDEDILVRRALARILSSEPEVELRVSGDLHESEKLIEHENPDIVLLDVGSLAPDNFSFFNTLRVRFPKTPVVVLSPRSEEGARAALYALQNGAIDVITKPEQNYALLFADNHLKKRLLPIISIVSQMIDTGTVDRQAVNTDVDDSQQEREKTLFPKSYRRSVNLIAMQGCTGGPKALFTIFKRFPAYLSAPVVIAQHFPKTYTSVLAHSLNKLSNITVKEAHDGAELEPGIAWLAPGGYHCEVQQYGNRSLLKVHQGPRENGVRPSADVLFRSAARLYGLSVLGVILSGHGADGITGAKMIQEVGGEVIVQNPQNALVGELPLSMLQSGLAHQYYPAEQIADEIVKRTFLARKKQASRWENHSIDTERVRYI
ncbi:chemotaxis protein CheB [Fodinibius salsisoli]|uniref:protein-glutamate methylesterase n=1 Tax=Fodinibius salsisoli TaxID=2820877 RepID=A0ABT3PIW8_9BACT|nr:chemotaxis protein CheB [Fodinibius salsisoli]MCW9705867.1 response regulator [Fodinibius salsisoli]